MASDVQQAIETIKRIDPKIYFQICIKLQTTAVNMNALNHKQNLGKNQGIPIITMYLER